MPAGAVERSSNSWIAPCVALVLALAKSPSDLHSSQAIEASGNLGERQEVAHKKKEGKTSPLEGVSYKGRPILKWSLIVLGPDPVGAASSRGVV
jgi:hypothetical protein